MVSDAVIAYGGMAGIPKRAKAVEQALIGKPWNVQSAENACTEFEKDFTPLSDWRASAEYRMLVSKNLLRRFFTESTEGSADNRLNREEAA